MPVVSDAELYRRRHDILEGARRCFAEFGYEGATVRRLEQATGKSRGAIFHHFGDKEGLFLSLAKEDAVRQTEVVAREGLVEVMREMLRHPERYDWLSTQLEITRMLRTDPSFEAKWRDHRAMVSDAVRDRLRSNVEAGRMRTDMPIEVLQLFLETVMDGFITRLASGDLSDDLESVLDLVEESVRGTSISGTHVRGTNIHHS